MSQEGSDVFDSLWRWKSFNYVDLGFIYLEPSLRDYVSQHDSLLHHKVALLPVKGQILLLAACEDQLQVLKTLVERIFVNREIVHEDFEESFGHIGEDAEHAALKTSRGVAQPKRHATIRKYAEQTRGCSFLLIFRSDWNLVVPRVSIQKAIVLMTCKSLEHLINKRKGEVILPCGSV